MLICVSCVVISLVALSQSSESRDTAIQSSLQVHRACPPLVERAFLSFLGSMSSNDVEMKDAGSQREGSVDHGTESETENFRMIGGGGSRAQSELGRDDRSVTGRGNRGRTQAETHSKDLVAGGS